METVSGTKAISSITHISNPSKSNYKLIKTFSYTHFPNYNHHVVVTSLDLAILILFYKGDALRNKQRKVTIIITWVEWCDGNKNEMIHNFFGFERRQPTYVWNVLFFGNFYLILEQKRKRRTEKEAMRKVKVVMNQLSDTLKVIDGSSKDIFEFFPMGKQSLSKIIGVIPGPHQWTRELICSETVKISLGVSWIIKSSSLIKIKHNRRSDY